MPDLEISRLPQLTGADLQGTDPVALADLSASETKKLTVADLVTFGISFVPNGTITGDKILSLNGSKLVADSVTAAQIGPDAVGSSELADLAVDTAAIQNAAVTNVKLAGGIDGNKILALSIGNAQIVDIDGAKILTGTITANQLGANCVTASELASNSVDTAAVQNGAITNDKLSINIDGSKILANSLTAAQLGPDSVGSSELANNAVDTAAIQNAAVTDAKLASGINGSKLTDGTVSNEKISGLDGAKLSGDSVTALQIAPNAIGSSELGNNSVDTSAVQNGAISNDKLASGIDGGKLLNGSVDTDQLKGDSVSASKIQDGSISDVKITGPIDASKLGTGTIPDTALGAVTDRGLDQATGKIGITNFVTAGTQGGISWDEQGLITAASGSVPPGDLPVATTTSVGAVSVPTAGGLGVTAGGAISIANSVTAATVRGIEYDEHGSIISVDAVVPEASIPLATTSSVGGVKVPGSDLTVKADGSIELADSGVVAGIYPKVGVNKKGIVTLGTVLAPGDIPPISADKITSGVLGDARIADRSIKNTKMADYSTVLIQEGSPTGTDHYTGQLWYKESDAQLRTWSGNSWVNVGFGRLSEENLRFCGTFNAATGVVDAVTQFGITAGLKAGDPIPTATDPLTGVYLVCTTIGTYNAEVYDNGDWTICLGASEGWSRVDTLNGGGGSSTTLKLGDLLDVTLTSAAAGDTLIYDAVANKWVNRPTAARKATFLEAFDGTRTSFTLTADAPSVNNLLLSLGGIIQEPGTDFTFAGPRSVNIASAPLAGLDYWVIIEGVPTTGGGGGGGGTTLPPGTAADELLQWSNALSSWQPSTHVNGGSF